MEHLFTRSDRADPHSIFFQLSSLVACVFVFLFIQHSMKRQRLIGWRPVGHVFSVKCLTAEMPRAWDAVFWYKLDQTRHCAFSVGNFPILPIPCLFDSWLFVATVGRHTAFSSSSSPPLSSECDSSIFWLERHFLFSGLGPKCQIFTGNSTEQLKACSGDDWAGSG